MIKLYNSLSQKKDLFKPKNKDLVTMYTCGPTVYNHAHIGNMRSFIIADLIKRFLVFSGYKVKQVMNITDVEDKIIRESSKNVQSLADFTQKYTESFISDLKSLNILLPEEMPKASEHINEMTDLISKLDKNGLTYQKNGNVYFKISEMKSYGELARINKQDLKENADGRLNTDDEYEKDNIGDFALWKAYSKKDGENVWNSPFGKGRPGWHIECSAMSMKYLGESFDIHTGGIDLKFPHHTNEIAQSEGATGKKFVNYWLHSEHLIVDGKKMSKSAGNFYRMSDILKKEPNPLLFRYILLKTHYRQKLDFSFDLFDEAKNVLTKYVNFLILLDLQEKLAKKSENVKIDTILDGFSEKFKEAMGDDLNISKGFAVFNEALEGISEYLQKLTKKQIKEVRNWIFRIDKVFGFIEISYKRYHDKVEKIKKDKDVQKLLEERSKARKNKDYIKSDEIRDTLLKKGVEVRDLGEKTEIEVVDKV